MNKKKITVLNPFLHLPLCGNNKKMREKKRLLLPSECTYPSVRIYFYVPRKKDRSMTRFLISVTSQISTSDGQQKGNVSAIYDLRRFLQKKRRNLRIGIENSTYVSDSEFH